MNLLSCCAVVVVKHERILLCSIFLFLLCIMLVSAGKSLLPNYMAACNWQQFLPDASQCALLPQAHGGAAPVGSHAQRRCSIGACRCDIMKFFSFVRWAQPQQFTGEVASLIYTLIDRQASALHIQISQPKMSQIIDSVAKRVIVCAGFETTSRTILVALAIAYIRIQSIHQLC